MLNIGGSMEEALDRCDSTFRGRVFANVGRWFSQGPLSFDEAWQDVLMVVMRKHGSLVWTDPEHFVAWASRVCLVAKSDAAREERRRRHGRKPGSLRMVCMSDITEVERGTVDDVIAPQPVQDAIEDARPCWADEAMDLLTQPQREVIEACVLCNVTVSTFARELGIGPERVRRRRVRGLERIRKFIEREVDSRAERVFW